MSNWTLFSNHGHVLVCLAGDSDARLRDVAADVGITERAVQKIVRDLQSHGMISVTKHGRRNRYRIHHKKNLRHELEAHCTLGDLMKLVTASKPGNREVRNDPISRVEDVLSRPVEAMMPSPESAEREHEQTEQAASEPIEVESVDVKSAKPGPTEVKPAKSIAPDSIERPQGSLF
jgi:predicted ArsR family transcriptional regulator